MLTVTVSDSSKTRFEPKGLFDLNNQNQYFNGWPVSKADDKTVVLAFPVEGWSGSAAVTIKQASDGSIDFGVYVEANTKTAKEQALSSLSLDED